MKIGINGLGRIGRCVLKTIIEKNSPLEVCLVNDICDAKTIAHLLQYDSVHGISKFNIRAESNNSVRINERVIPISAETDPTKIEWDKYGVSLVIECTGRFVDKESAKKHLRGSVKKVIVSAPCKDADTTLVIGINEDKYDKDKDVIISNGSCTTNCIAPLLKVLNDAYQVESGSMTTIHSYTLDQQLLDASNRKGDLRRARAAGLSMIPTTTGAAKAIGLVIPELDGKISGFSVRVPTPNVSFVDLIVKIKSKKPTVEEVNKLFKEASEKRLKNILGYNDKELVSCDFNGSPYSSIFDSAFTKVIGNDLIKVVSWYDNETGFSHRLKELTKMIAQSMK